MKKKACFICGTPYHVLSSIIIRYQLNIDADIIIYDAFDNTDKLKHNLQIEHVFDKVTILNREKDCGLPHSVLGRYLFAFAGYFSINKYVNRIIPTINSYTDVFYANDQHSDTIDRFIYCYVKKYMPNSTLHCFEDGWVSYDESYYGLTTMDYLFRKLIVRSNTHILDSEVFLYSRELFFDVNPDSKMTINSIEKPNQMTIDKLKHIFSYYILDDISAYDTIVLDTVREEVFKNDDSKRFNDIVKEIADKKKVIVKSHPRDNKRYFDYEYFKMSGFPFEILCLYNDFSNYTFINYYSSAVFTPKLLFNQEPNLIFTYPLFSQNKNRLWGDREQIITRFRKMYKDNSKIIVLKTTKSVS